MATHVVELNTEQKAVVEVEAPEDATEETLTELALAVLDKTQGSGWQTEFAWTEHWLKET